MRVSGCVRTAGLGVSAPFIPNQKDKAAIIATAEAARKATTQLAERVGRRLTSSVSQGSRSKSRAIVFPIGSAHLLGGSHAHQSKAAAYDLPNA
jgi:hypothetical protein